MRSVRTDPVIGLIAEVVLLAALAATVGLSPLGWVVGAACGVVTCAVLTRSLRRAGQDAWSPASQVTLIRAALVGGVAALVADSLTRPSPVVSLVSLSAAALVLDAVDGWIARRTRTANAFGARFDMEVDASLILVLSVYVAPSIGWWVLAIGAARYVFVAAGWLLPWLRRSSPPRYWCKVVAATQGVVLTVAAAEILPHVWAEVAVAVALALLAESFGRDVWWLWLHRADETRTAALVSEEQPAITNIRSRVRTARAGLTTVIAAFLVWFALVGPDELNQLTPSVFLRIPVEGLLLVVVALVLPARWGRVIAAVMGFVLGLLTIVKIIDIGFWEALDRPFNPVTDRGYFGPAIGVLRDSIGRAAANAAVVAVALTFIALLVLVPLALMRLTRIVGRHRTRSVPVVIAVGVGWAICAVLGLQDVPGAPIASTSAASLAFNQVREIHAGIVDGRVFGEEINHDPLRNTPTKDLLTGLRGKDVIFAFVESYGRVAVQGTTFSPRVDAVLKAGGTKLHAAGFAARSGFLTSPTFGGISWLAHSTLQSGLWVDNQQRYDQLTSSDRFTLSDAFNRAGWRTVGDVPSDSGDWPGGSSFYHYDKVYNDANVGYRGPRFSYARIPDQYSLSALQRLELAKTNRPPVMAEADLVSSHTPWAPLPHLIGWNQVGDGSVYDGMPAQGESADQVWSDADKVRASYGRSIQYSLNALVSFVQKYANNNTVLVVLGDHQPATIVSGEDASHDVPISIIAHDPSVMRRVAGWGWNPGLRPDPEAPVWPMSNFRDRFLTTFGSAPSTRTVSASPARQLP